LDTTSSIQTRRIVANGCPNHYTTCTGKSGVSGCGAVGEAGGGTEATESSKDLTIPLYPVLRDSYATDDSTAAITKCTLGDIAIALNGVSIYGGAVNDQCEALDTTNALSEWNSFDCCSGHAEQSGDYHYHFPPSCLLDQIGDFNDGHSAQIGMFFFSLSLPFLSLTTHTHTHTIGWSYDGFPVYGPKGPGGIDMKYSPTACDGDSCTIDTSLDLYTGSICLDKCGGYEGTIEHDEYKYRYYMVGATSDLYSLPSDPRPGVDAAAVFGFSINCYRGYTVSELSGGATAYTDGTTSSFTPGVKTTPGQYMCISGCQASGGSSTVQGYFCSGSTDSSCNSNFDPTSLQDYQCAASGGDDTTTTTESSGTTTTTSTPNTTPAVATTTASSNPTTTTAAPTATTPSDTGGDDSPDGGDSSESSDDDDTTEIALIAVGAVVGVVVVAVFAIGFCRTKK
jgi:hypothetical protein